MAWWWVSAAVAMVPPMDQELAAPPGADWQEIVGGDFDGDGYGDLIVTTRQGAVSQLLFPGGPGGPTGAVVVVGGGGTDLVVLDANGDGIDDWLESSCVAGNSVTVRLWLGGSVPAATPAQSFTVAGCNTPVTGDFNADGRDDLALNDGVAGGGAHYARIFHGNAAGMYAGANLAVQMGLGPMAAGDLDGDGDADLVLGGPGEFFDVLRGRRIGLEYWSTWQVNLPVGQLLLRPVAGAVGRGNGDAFGEILLPTRAAAGGSYSQTAWLGSAAGPVSPAFAPLPLQCSGTLALVHGVPDQDADGRDELLVACPDSTGDVRFIVGGQLADNHVGDAVDLAVADLDGDGFPDRAILEAVPGGFAVSLDYGP